MTGLDDLVAQPALQSLGWTLLHFLWQGAVVAALYAVLRATLRRRSSDARYTAACGALLAMLLLTVATFAVLYAEAPRSAPRGAFEGVVADTSFPEAAAPRADLAPPDLPTRMRAWSRAWVEPSLPWLTSLWLVGVSLLSLRFLGGLAVAQRFKRRYTRPADDAWQAMVDRLRDRLGVVRAVRLCESAVAEVPTVVGWLSPVILVPAGMLAGLSREQVEALLAHELAHVRRCDYLVNVLQTAVETLLFYHPAVWWVSKHVREERENCCDDLAVAACGDVLVYAKALADLEDLRGAVPAGALAATGGSLVRRVERLLGRPAGAHYAPAYLAGVLAAVAVASLWVGAKAAGAPARIVAAVAAVGLAPSDAEPAAGQATAPERPQPPALAEAAVVEIEEPESIEEPQEAEDPQEPEAEESGVDFIDELAASGYQKLSVDELIALRNHGVTGEYIRALAAAGYAKLSVDDLVAFAVHGVNPEYISALAASGFKGLPADELVAFRVHGVDPNYVRHLASLGYANLSGDEIVAFAVHGVDSAYVEELKAAGYSSLPAEEIVAFKIHGVTGEYVRALAAAGFSGLSPDDVLAMRIHGVTPAYIRELGALGLAGFSADEVVGLKVQGVTPAYVREIRELGYAPTAEEIVELRVHGVTATYIRSLKERGFDKLTIDQIVRLRIAGIK